MLYRLPNWESNAMKKTTAILFGLFIGAVMAVPAHAKDDPYDKLARELSEISVSSQTKIAIIPFSYVDKKKTDAGTVISERLTTRIVKLKTFKVIERQLLENVMQELHLETTGVVDVETTKRLGKILGVEALITGTIMDIGEDTSEINARTINAETAELLATSSVEVKRTWGEPGHPAPAPTPSISQPVQQQEQEQVYEQPVQKQSRPMAKGDGFLDFFFGSVNGTADVAFSNSAGNERETYLRVDVTGNGLLDPNVTFRKVEYKDVKMTQASPLIGMRVAGFGNYFGGAFEISYLSQQLAKQKTKFYMNDSSTGRDFEFYVDDYLKVDVVTLLSGDLMFRFSKGMVQPYVGCGLGLTLNMVSSPYIYGYDSGVFKAGFSDVAAGLLVRFPIGVRMVFGNGSSLFIEYRTNANYFTYDRGISSESDTVTMAYSSLLLGAGIKF